MEDVLEFKGKFAFLSNFFPATFTWNNIRWNHAEGAYQAAKSGSFTEQILFSQMTAVEAKRAGKKVILRPDWERVKYDIMYEIVAAKFNQNPPLLKRLLATGHATLEEGNYWKDRIWGVCPAGSGKGNNWLGKILMSIRDNYLFQEQISCQPHTQE